MGPLDALNHVLNFLAPAAALSVLLCLAGRVFWRKSPVTQAWWAQIAINFVLGSGVLLAGLWGGGRDGKMLTYAALVLACASSQWCLLRAWRR